MSDDPTYLAQIEPVLKGMRKAESPNNNRDPPPRRDPRRRRRRLLKARRRGRGGHSAGGAPAFLGGALCRPLILHFVTGRYRPKAAVRPSRAMWKLRASGQSPC